MSGALNTLLTIGGLAFAGYYLWFHTDFREFIQNIRQPQPPALRPAPRTAVTGGAASVGGAITQTGSCPGGTSCGPCRPQSGGIRCECDNYPGDAYEATFCGTWSGDDLSIKMWGPKHSGSNACCWCILNTSPDGKMRMRGEGPHPKTSDIGITGSVGGKPTCVKALIRPGPKGAHIEGYGLVGGKWVKGLTYDGPCGLNQKSTKNVGSSQQVSFRCDGQMKATCATVKPIGVANANFARGFQYLQQPPVSYLRHDRQYNCPKIL